MVPLVGGLLNKKNKMEVQGKIKLVEEAQTFSSGFVKQEFVITTDEKYPQDIKLEFVKDKVDQLKKVKRGDNVTVHFNLRGNEYQGKYYVNLQAWKLSKENGSGSNASEPNLAGNLDDLEESPF
jgi:hypothetical protein